MTPEEKLNTIVNYVKGLRAEIELSQKASKELREVSGFCKGWDAGTQFILETITATLEALIETK